MMTNNLDVLKSHYTYVSSQVHVCAHGCILSLAGIINSVNGYSEYSTVAGYLKMVTCLFVWDLLSRTVMTQ